MNSINLITKKKYLAAMRNSAMSFRSLTHPQACNYGFAARMNHAAAALKLATEYRNMAKEVR